MRSLAVAAIVLGCGAVATVAGAQALAPVSPDASITGSPSALAGGGPGQADLAQVLDREAFLPGRGPAEWSSGQVRLANHDGSVDSVRVSVGGALVSPGGLPLAPGVGQFDPRAYEVTVSRDWPRAVSFGNDRYAVDVTPHAGVGMTSIGGSAEAGAQVELSARRDSFVADRLRALGVRDGARFGDQGRWYLFAAASGRAVGWNVLHGDGGWNRAGLTTDPTSTLVGDAQVGLGWRKGSLQTSVGLIHREVKGAHMIFGQDTKSDTVAAFTLSIRPRR